MAKTTPTSGTDSKSKQSRKAAMLTGGETRGHVRFTKPASMKESVPTADHRLPISLATDIIDGYEGTSRTESIFGATPNYDFIAKMLVDDSVRAAVLHYLLDRSIGRAITGTIKSTMIRPNEAVFTKDNYHEAVINSVEAHNDERVRKGGRDAADVITELSLGAMIRLGLVSENGRYAQQMSYGFERVGMAAIRTMVSMIEIRNVIDKDVKQLKIDTDRRQSANVLADTIALPFTRVGHAILQASDMASVIDDIIVGVRACIDPNGIIGGETAAIHSSWRNHSVVQELSTCLPFVRAALTLAPRDVRVLNELSVLDKNANLVLEYLRQSERFRWISRSDSLRHYGLHKVYNVRGAPISAVLYRDMKVNPTAQAVISVYDALVGENAVSIIPSVDRITDVVVNAYHQATFEIGHCSKVLADVISDVASMSEGGEGVYGVYHVDASQRGRSLADVAALLADNLFVTLRDTSVLEDVTDDMTDEELEAVGARRPQSDATAEYDPSWWYVVNTKERGLILSSGAHYSDQVYTSDPVEAILAVETFTPRDLMPARPQSLSELAFNSRVMGFEMSNTLVKLGTNQARFSFSVELGGVTFNGAFAPQDLGSVRAGGLTSLVRPVFNTAVMEAYGACIREAQEMTLRGLSSRMDPVMSKSLFDRLLRRICALSQKLSPTFRDEVQHIMIERVLRTGKQTGEDAMRMRATMLQGAFTTFADLVSLHFFMVMQGVQVDEAWKDVFSSENIERVIVDTDSDRSPATRI